MLLKLRPCDDYFDLTHDLSEEGVYNDPDLPETWSWEGDTRKNTKEKPCSINGSPYLSAESVGVIIIHLVKLAREGRVCGAYDYVDLSGARCY